MRVPCNGVIFFLLIIACTAYTALTVLMAIYVNLSKYLVKSVHVHTHTYTYSYTHTHTHTDIQILSVLHRTLHYPCTHSHCSNTHPYTSSLRTYNSCPRPAVISGYFRGPKHRTSGSFRPVFTARYVPYG